MISRIAQENSRGRRLERLAAPLRRPSARIALAIALLPAASIAACGDAGDSSAARIGGHTISKATVEHWTSVIHQGGAFHGFRGRPRGTSRQRAVALLISSNWLIGEATRQGVPIEPVTVDQVLAQRESEAGQQARQLSATGQTIADVKFEIRAELAGEAVLEKLAVRADHVTRRQVSDFYRRNSRLFRTPEVRVTDLLENQSSPAAASALVNRIGTGRRFKHLAYHELVTQTPGFMRTPEKTRLVKAIFAANPGVVSSPMPLNGSWAVFIVRKLLPSKPEAFSTVRSEVAMQLRASRRRQLQLGLDHEYKAYWRHLTRCESDYVGPGCPQYKGSLGAYEDPFSLQGHPALAGRG